MKSSIFSLDITITEKKETDTSKTRSGVTGPGITCSGGGSTLGCPTSYQSCTGIGQCPIRP